MKEKNKNLSAEQKLVLFEEGTEPPGSSELNNFEDIYIYKNDQIIKSNIAFIPGFYKIFDDAGDVLMRMSRK